MDKMTESALYYRAELEKVEKRNAELEAKLSEQAEEIGNVRAKNAKLVAENKNLFLSVQSASSRFCKKHGYIKCKCPEDCGLSLIEYLNLVSDKKDLMKLLANSLVWENRFKKEMEENTSLKAELAECEKKLAETVLDYCKENIRNNNCYYCNARLDEPGGPCKWCRTKNVQTEREMHNAWRKRAEQAEAELAAKDAIIAEKDAEIDQLKCELSIKTNSSSKNHKALKLQSSAFESLIKNGTEKDAALAEYRECIRESYKIISKMKHRCDETTWPGALREISIDFRLWEDVVERLKRVLTSPAVKDEGKGE